MSLKDTRKCHPKVRHFGIRTMESQQTLGTLFTSPQLSKNIILISPFMEEIYTSKGNFHL